MAEKMPDNQGYKREKKAGRIRFHGKARNEVHEEATS